MLVAFMITIEQYKLCFEMESAHVCCHPYARIFICNVYVTQEITIFSIVQGPIYRKLVMQYFPLFVTAERERQVQKLVNKSGRSV